MFEIAVNQVKPLTLRNKSSKYMATFTVLRVEIEVNQVKPFDTAV